MTMSTTAMATKVAVMMTIIIRRTLAIAAAASGLKGVWSSDIG